VPGLDRVVGLNEITIRKLRRQIKFGHSPSGTWKMAFHNEMSVGQRKRSLIEIKLDSLGIDSWGLQVILQRILFR
jgi:hypothetical protein